jgi:hypothetical protein
MGWTCKHAAAGALAPVGRENAPDCTTARHGTVRHGWDAPAVGKCRSCGDRRRPSPAYSDPAISVRRRDAALGHLLVFVE